jgi:hypothetical protein
MKLDVELTDAEYGWLLMAIRTQRRIDLRHLDGLRRKFGDTADTTNKDTKVVLGASVADKIR